MKLRKSMPLRITAAVLMVVTFLSAVTMSVLSIVAVSGNVYVSTYSYLEDGVLTALVNDHLHDVFYTWRRGDDPLQLYAKSNLLFRLEDMDGTVILQNYPDGMSLPEDSVNQQIGVGQGQYVEGERIYVESYTIYGAVNRNLPHMDRYSLVIGALRLFYDLRYALPFLAVGFALLWILLLCFLMCAAGWKKGREEPTPGWFSWVPFDLLLGAVLISVPLQLELCTLGPDTAVWLVTCCVADGLVLSLLLVSLARRIKTHTLLRRTVLYHVLSFTWRILRAVLGLLGRFFSAVLGRIAMAVRGLPLVWKTAVGVLLNGVVDILAAFAFANLGPYLIFILVKDLLLGGAIILTAVVMRKIQAGGQRLAAGALNTKIDTRFMPLDFRIFAETMNRIGDGMSAAVEERMRSERFRTELITNVSHDIKTPLTSIVNYVDLIKKENVTEEPLAGYVAVLDRQSARLKKLTEDLLEASKAATGNIPVNREPCDVRVFLEQAAGEYSERIRAAQLELIVQTSPEEIRILADGRLLWRVFDNLMHNIVKYAMPGSRVYLSLCAEAEEVKITFRNISADPLNLTGEELLERFTRGDSSRHTEGSGLGLSIANSLTELQGGTMTLTVDGDLFKVTLCFPRG